MTLIPTTKSNPTPNPTPNHQPPTLLTMSNPYPQPLPAQVPSAGELVVDGLRVMHDLCVHGEAWKLGGSSQWRVLSDARVKDVLGDFTLGGDTLLKIVPRIFRYKGQLPPNPTPTPTPTPNPNPNP